MKAKFFRTKSFRFLLVSLIVGSLVGCSSAQEPTTSFGEDSTESVSETVTVIEETDELVDAQSDTEFSTESSLEETTDVSSETVQDGSEEAVFETVIEESTTEESLKLTDVDFIVNLGKGLETRWALTLSDEYNSDAMNNMSTSEVQNADTLFVNAELDAIGSLSDYEFSNQELKGLAETYMMGLNLQQEGIQYRGTDENTEEDQTWGLGYDYRVVVIKELYDNFGLTIDEKYQEALDTCLDDNTFAQKEIAIQEYVNEVGNSIEYVLDEEKSDEYTSYYKAIIENTTDYEIDSLELDINFLDSSGIIIYQTTDYLSNFKAGDKIQSSITYQTENGDFEKIDVSPTAYWE